MRFNGFPREAFTFYAELSQNNDRSWWYEHRHVYDSVIVPTMRAFIAELHPYWRPMTIYRPFRNVRFSPDKTPYKTACGAIGADEDGVPHYLQLSGAGIMVARGFYVLSEDQLPRLHDAVHEDDDLTLASAIREVEGTGVEVHTWDRLTTAPRGYSKYHRRVEMLRWGGITAGRSWPAEHGWLHTRRALMMVQQSWTASQPLMEWMVRRVGAPQL